jgi:DNA-binding NarL/FixJ family response regulator
VTSEQRRAHLRLLETLPKRRHVCIGVDEERRRAWKKPKGRVDTSYSPEFLTEKKRAIERLRCQGLNQKQIAELWGVTPPTVSRFLRLYKQRCSPL